MLLHKNLESSSFYSRCEIIDDITPKLELDKYKKLCDELQLQLKKQNAEAYSVIYMKNFIIKNMATKIHDLNILKNRYRKEKNTLIKRYITN